MILHTFYGEGKYQDRVSEIVKVNGILRLDMYIRHRLKESRTYPDKSESYVESAAENWVMGIL